MKNGQSVIISYLRKRGYQTIPSDFYAKIQEWKDWYINGVDEYHKRYIYNGKSVVEKDIKSLGMAKTVSEIWGNLLMNEKVGISTGIEASDKALKEILNDNGFEVKANQLCEMYCALGTGAFVEYIEQGRICIDYINADLIYPLSWNNRGIAECAFGSNVHMNNEDYIYIQMHLLDGGKYVIENHLLKVDDSETKEIPLPDGLIPIINTNSDIPLFQIVKPNIVNNAYETLSLPMGASVYAGAIDVLQTIDNTFDSLDIEVETGRRVVFLKASGFYTDEQGRQHNVISDKETVLRSIGDGGEDDDAMIHDFSPALRTGEIKEALQLQLNLLSQKVGMGANQFEFTDRGLKTATEVISEDSDLYQNLKKHEIVLRKALTDLVNAISFLSNTVGPFIPINEVVIDFDDSIIEDSEAERKQDQIDLGNGTLRPEEYRARWRGESVEEALANLPHQAEVLE